MTVTGKKKNTNNSQIYLAQAITLTGKKKSVCARDTGCHRKKNNSLKDLAQAVTDGTDKKSICPIHLAQAITDGTGKKVTVLKTWHRLSQKVQTEINCLILHLAQAANVTGKKKTKQNKTKQKTNKQITVIFTWHRLSL